MLRPLRPHALLLEALEDRIVPSSAIQVQDLGAPSQAIYLAARLASPAVPHITQLGPFYATARSPGFTLTVSGTDFPSNSVVQWNGTTLDTTFVSPTTLRAQVPATLLIEEEPAHVTVLSEGNGTSNVQPFLVLPKETISAPFAAAPSAVFFVPASEALYRHDDSGWVQIGGAGSVVGVSAVSDKAGNVTAFAVTTDHSLFRYTATGGWQQIGGKGTILYASAGLDVDGKPDVWVITGDGSLTRWSTAGGWYASPVGAPNTVAAAQANQIGGVYVVTTDRRQSYFGSVWTASFPKATLLPPAWGSGWLFGQNYRTVAGIDSGAGIRGMLVKVYGVAMDDSLVSADLGDEVGSYTTYSGLKVRSLRAGATTVHYSTADDELGGGEGHDPLRGVQDFTVGAQDRLFAVTADGSVWQRDAASGWLQLAPAGFGTAGG